MRKVLGIDPGLTRCGVAVVSGKAINKSSLHHTQTIKTAAGVELDERVYLIGSQIKTLISRFEPTEIALERVFAQANLKSVMGVAQISGVVLFLAREFNLPIRFFTPTQVKAAVTGDGRANKDAVSKMTSTLLGGGDLFDSPDSADAAAVSLTAIANPSMESSEPTKAQRAWSQAINQTRK